MGLCNCLDGCSIQREFVWVSGCWWGWSLCHDAAFIYGTVWAPRIRTTRNEYSALRVTFARAEVDDLFRIPK